MAVNTHRRKRGAGRKNEGEPTDYKYLNTKPYHMFPLERPVMLAVRETNGGYRQ
jgi:hypothetical protein